MDVRDWATGFSDNWSDGEQALVAGLPEHDMELIRYLKRFPEREEAVVLLILDRYRQELRHDYSPNPRQAARQMQHLANTLSQIEKMNLAQRADSAELDDYYASISYQASSFVAEQTFQELHNKRYKRTGLPLHPAEESALWRIANLETSTRAEVEQFREAIATDVVIWKMLSAWLGEMTEDDPCASETDLFGANQLQILKGSSGKFLGRDAIDKRITSASTHYAGAPRDDFDTIFRQTLVQELYPNGDSPIFWFRGKSYISLRKDRRSRKNRIHRATHKVLKWECESCTLTFDPGYSDDALIPWAYRTDKRIKPRREVTLVDRLPKQAFKESRFMCICWRENTGVLRPRFSN